MRLEPLFSDKGVRRFQLDDQVLTQELRLWDNVDRLVRHRTRATMSPERSTSKQVISSYLLTSLLGKQQSNRVE